MGEQMQLQSVRARLLREMKDGAYRFSGKIVDSGDGSRTVGTHQQCSMHGQIRSCKLNLTILNVISCESIDHHVHSAVFKRRNARRRQHLFEHNLFLRESQRVRHVLRHGNIEARILSPMQKTQSRLVRGHANRNGRPLSKTIGDDGNGSTARARAQYDRSGAYQRRDIS